MDLPIKHMPIDHEVLIGLMDFWFSRIISRIMLTYNTKEVLQSDKNKKTKNVG